MIENIHGFPNLVLAEPDYERSVIIKEFFQNRNVAKIIEIVRDGIETLDVLKEYNPSGFKLTGIIINSNLSYLDELMTGINNDPNLKEIPLIIFSEEDKNFITAKYSINEKSYVLKPMQLLRCEEIIKYIDNPNSFREIELFRGKYSYLL